MNRFPFEGKSDFTASADPAVEELQTAVRQVQDMLMGMARVDSGVRLLARFDENLQSQVGPEGVGTGPIRYWQGRFEGSQGVLVEGAGENMLTNPSAEFDTATWSAADASVELSRLPSPTFQEDGVTSNGAMRIGGTNKAGQTYVKTTATVFPNRSYSGSVYVYSERPLKAKLELAFTGGTPVNYDTGEVTLDAGEWTRLELHGKNSNNNTSVELRVHLVRLAPEFQPGSRLTRKSPDATALVTDNAMDLVAGNVVMVATSANPSGAEKYSWHMVTTGATGVSSSSLRLDDVGSAPTFPSGARLSKWIPGTSIPSDDNTTTLNAGDLVFCKLVGQSYAWHLVTSAGHPLNAALRLDDMPEQPEFSPNSRISRFAPDATAPVTDNAMVLSAGDLVMCYTLNAPGSEEYQFHIVTAGATGVSSGSLRLNDSLGAPQFAAGSRLSKLSLSGAVVSDNALVLDAGDFVFAWPLRNPAGNEYGWHMVTTGATGVSSPDLRLDQSSSEMLVADAAQLEEGDRVSSYIDSLQGDGFTGSLGARTQRAASRLSFTTTGALAGSAGTVAFWMYPLWPATDGKEHILFDAAVNDSRNRIRFSKSKNGRLVLSIYDGSAQLAQVFSDATMMFTAREWVHLAFSYSAGTLKLYLDGEQLTTTATGLGTGALEQLPSQMFLGTDFRGSSTGGAVFDDLVVKATAASAEEVDGIARANVPYQGMALTYSGYAQAAGAATTDPSAGTQIAVAHGLGIPPSFVQLTSQSNGVVYLSAEPDDANFYVKGSASSLDFIWRAFA